MLLARVILFMSTKPPKPPNPVPEEDLSLHENFSPIIAENGLIRQPKAPEVEVDSLPDFLTRLDTLQDLVELRHAEQAEQKAQNVQEQTSTSPLAEKDAPRADEEEINLSTFPLRGKMSEGQMRGKVNNEEPYHNSATSLPAATTFLTVRQANTTALVPASKLTLARRITLLKRKRQHKRRLAERAKQRAAQAAAVPPKTPKSTSKNQTPKRPSRWKWALAILLFLFLGGISGLVPVEKIPLLRNLAYAMGFDKTDTSRISFLRALLTWTDKTVGLPGNWSDEEGENYLFARRERAQSAGGAAQEDGPGLLSLNARLDRAGGQTSLIDMQALNALQRKKGYALDGVQGAVKLTPGQEEANLGPATVRDAQVNVRTEANRDKGEVFFGSDNSAVNRNFKDGYDSTKALAKIKNPHIADGKPIDWLLNTTQQLMRTNSPLGGLNRQLSATRVSWGNSAAALGEQKPHKDLYYAWITSRMGNRTPNIMLKKSLVDTGFLGADMPTMASTALGGGVQIDAVSFQEDQESWKEYLEFERKCKEALGTRGEEIDKALKDFKEFYVKPPDYPTTCYDMLNSDSGKFLQEVEKKVQDTCNSLSKNYEALGQECAMAISKGTDCGKIKIDDGYKKSWEDDQEHCKGKLKEKCKEYYGAECDDVVLNDYKNSSPWKKENVKTEKIAGIQAAGEQDEHKFATLIRGKEIEPGKWVAEKEEQLDHVRQTIGNNISDVFKK